MSAADHIASTIATIRKQVDGAERRIVEGNALEASGPIAGAISRLASLQVEIARLDGYETARREARAQADLDAHVRAKRGREVIASVLETRGFPANEARARAGNMATALGQAEPGDDLVAAIVDALGGTCGARPEATVVLVLVAWASSERAPLDVDAEGPCRAGDEERCAPEPKTAPPLAAE